MANPFDADYGSEQGRILSSTAPLGDYIFQLGSSVPLKVYRFNYGSYVSLAKDVDVTGVTFYKFTADIRGVSVLPSPVVWELDMMVDGGIVSSATIDGRSRRLTDMGVNVGGLTGTHEISFQLSLLGLSEPTDVELPGVGVDAIVEDNSEILLYNRTPEPNEIGYPANFPLTFRIEAGSGTVDLTRTRVLINGMPVYVNQTITGGWGANTSVVAFLAGNGYTFTIQPNTPFGSEQTITVEVFSTLVGGPTDLIHEVWSYVTADTESPEVAEAFATSQKTIRVTFDDVILQDNSAASSLTIGNYSLVLVSGAPAVLPLILSVEANTDRSVTLTLDRQMTRGAVYQLTVVNVADTSENVITAPANVATFLGYACPTPEDRDFKFFEMLPPPARDLDTTEGRGDLKKFSLVLQEVIDLLLCEVDRWPTILDPDTAPESWLDSMLADMGNPFDFELSLSEKRNLVQILVDIYGSKGTGPGIVNAVRLFLGIELTLNVPGWAPFGLGDAVIGQSFILGSSDEGVLLTFHLTAVATLTAKEESRLLAIVDYMSDAREFFLLIKPPALPSDPDHWSMNFSGLGFQTTLH